VPPQWPWTAPDGGAAAAEWTQAERHPWERPLLAATAAVTLAALALAVHMLWTGGAHAWTAAVLLALPAACWTVRGMRHAEQRAQAVRVSPTQFPEVHAEIARLATEMGLHTTPDAYVRPGGRRPRSAAAGGHGARRYIVLPGELFEPDARLRDPEALRFVLAHQLGHIAAGHTSFWLRAGTSIGRLVPVLGPALSRAMEYTADNHAHAHCPEGAHAIRMLAAGRALYRQVGMGELAERGRRDRGGFVFLYNLLSSRPVNIKRIAAIRDRSRPGRLFL